MAGGARAGAPAAALRVGAGAGPRVGAATPGSRAGPGALARAGARRPANTIINYNIFKCFIFNKYNDLKKIVYPNPISHYINPHSTLGEQLPNIP